MSPSVILFVISREHLGFVWLASLVHAVLSNLGLESSFSSTEGYHFPIFPIQPFFGRRALFPPCFGDKDLRETSVLGKLFFSLTAAQSLHSRH